MWDIIVTIVSFTWTAVWFILGLAWQAFSWLLDGVPFGWACFYIGIFFCIIGFIQIFYAIFSIISGIFELIGSIFR
jgi:hypothetical protein